MYPALKLFQSTGTKKFHAKAEFFTSPLKNESGTQIKHKGTLSTGNGTVTD